MQEYNKTDQKLHYLSQVLAKLNRTFVPTEEDDSHTNLYFDPLTHRIYSRWIDSGSEKIIGSLNVNTFHFEFLNEKLNVHKEFKIADNTVPDIEKSIDRSLSEFGLKNDGFKDDLHYEIPDYGFENSSPERWTKNEINQWEHIRELSNSSCYQLLGTLQSDSEVRIWPHHFDTGIYTEPNSKIGLGFGLAMKDQMAGDAYFYFTGYSLDGKTINYDEREPLQFGKWQIGDYWNGAILPVSELKDTATDAVQTFILQASRFYLT